MASIFSQPSQHVAQQAIMVDLGSGDTLVPVSPTIADEFGKCSRTIKRWARDPQLNFPNLVAIRGRLYASRRALDAWKTAKLAVENEAA